MEKRGFLLAEETLKMILAVIAIGFLAYLLFSIYSARKESKELELAKSSLEHLIEEINSDATEIDIYNPANSWWYVASWPISGEKPLYCENVGWERCLCICKFSFFQETTPSKLSDLCDNEGICMESSAYVNDNGKFYIQIENPPLRLKINNEKEISKNE